MCNLCNRVKPSRHPLRNNLWRRMQAFCHPGPGWTDQLWRVPDNDQPTKGVKIEILQIDPNSPLQPPEPPKTYLGRSCLCQLSHSTAATDIIGIGCDDCDNSSLTMNCTLGTLVYICAVCTLSAVTLRGNMLNFNFGWLRHFVFTLSLPKPRAIATRRRKPQIDPF